MNEKAKHEAKELVFRMYKIVGLEGFGYDCDPIDIIDNALHKSAQEKSKQLALLYVDEILKELDYLHKDIPSSTILMRGGYWQEVKQEIEKL